MKNLSFLLVLLFISSCSYKVTRTYSIKDSPSYIVKSDTSKIIVKNKNLYGLNAEYVGSIKLDDTGTTIKCSEKRAIEKLKQEANYVNANLINITKEIYPGYSTCYRCVADFYNYKKDSISDKILKQEKRIIIKYDSIKKLQWEDFKLELSDSIPYPYDFTSNIELNSVRRSFWTGAFKDFKAQAVFYSDISGVKASYRNEENLNHVNGLFKLTHIYAIELEQYLALESIKTSNPVTIQEIVDKYLQELFYTQKKYINETDYGRNKVSQQNWNRYIENKRLKYTKNIVQHIP